VTNIESIRVGAAQAVTKALRFSEKSGARFKYVQVGGFFSELSGAVQLGVPTGVWSVTLAPNPDMSNQVNLEVDMATGAVTDIED
jgi:hypothetical protein